MDIELSDNAKVALVNVGTNRQGAMLKGATPEAAQELRNARLIGTGDGLTRRGGIARESLVTASLDKAFG